MAVGCKKFLAFWHHTSIVGILLFETRLTSREGALMRPYSIFRWVSIRQTTAQSLLWPILLVCFSRFLSSLTIANSATGKDSPIGPCCQCSNFRFYGLNYKFGTMSQHFMATNIQLYNFWHLFSLYYCLVWLSIRSTPWSGTCISKSVSLVMQIVLSTKIRINPSHSSMKFRKTISAVKVDSNFF